MELRRLTSDDLEAYFAIRLRALERAPSAFLRSAEEERIRGPDFFGKILANTGDEQAIFGALFNGALIGTIGIFRPEGSRVAHKAFIWGMYVDEEHSGRGIGGKLLDLAVKHAREKMNASLVQLAVESTNEAARTLYESRKFTSWGVEPKAMMWNGRFWNDIHMVLDLEA
jgi:RimJ/RimL family protein N-acetyltransferase